MRLLHLSDLHFGASNNFPDNDQHSYVLRVLQDDPRAANIDLLVVSGDLTWSSSPDEFTIARAFLAGVRQTFQGTKILIVPGNHDVDLSDLLDASLRPVEPDTRQDRFIGLLADFFGGELESQFPFLKSASVPRRPGIVQILRLPEATVVGVNSAAFIASTPGATSPETPVGVSPQMLLEVEAQLGPREHGETRILVLHHHLLPFADADWTRANGYGLPEGPDPTIIADSGHVQAWLSRNGFEIVLHGHRHMPHGRLDRLWTARTGNASEVFVLGAGSTGVTKAHRPSGEPLSYNVLELRRGGLGDLLVDIESRRIDLEAGYHRAGAYFSIATSVRSPEALRPSVLLFDGASARECHGRIERDLGGVELVRNFVSVVHQAGSDEAIPTLRYEGAAADSNMVRNAFRSLYVGSAGMTGHAPLRSGLRLRHGERIYGRADGRETSPFDAAVEALMRNDGRRCYINLFDTKRDAPDSAPEPPPGLVGLQFHVEDPKSTARLHAVATFRHLELSFWWGVNIYEVGQLMQDVQSRNQDAIRSLGSITMFAALAGWETNLRAVLTARLDTLEISDLIGHVFACISSEQPMDSHRVLSELLIEKAKYTHVTNIECFGLRNLSETIAGALQTSLNSTARAEQWLRIRDVLRRSVDVLEQAIALPNQRQRYVTEAVGLVAEAGRMIDCVNG